MPRVLLAASIAFVACASPPAPSSVASPPSASSAVAITSSSAPPNASSSAMPIEPSPPAFTEAEVIVHRDLVPKIASCNPPDVPADGAVNEALDVTYESIGDLDLNLDVAWPKDDIDHPLVVIVHGGGWSAGKKSLYEKDARRLASVGFVGATIEYRLAPKHKFPAGISDVRCAIRFLRAKHADYHVDRSRVAILGASAGAHLAAMIANERDVDALDDGSCPVKDVPVGVSAAVEYYGPFDLRAPDTIYKGLMLKAIDEFLGTGFDRKELEKRASPLAYVGAASVPALLFHDPKDGIIPIAQSKKMEQALLAAGIPALLVENEGAKPHHGFPILSTKHPKVACTTIELLKQALK